MSGNRDKILELMHSKSGPSLPKSGRIEDNLGVKDSQKGNGTSLYNTSSFDDMTMKMTIKHNASNISNLSNRSEVPVGKGN